MEKIKKCLKNLHWKTSKEEIIWELDVDGRISK
jgi:hypothetical protein